MRKQAVFWIAGPLLAGLLSTPTWAQDARGHREHDTHLFLDQRFHHEHYYPARGHMVPALPGGSISVRFGGEGLYFHAGVWFRAGPGGFLVIAPPIGVVVPLLPPAYVTLWIGGLPYYYANDTYYVASPAGDGYTVVAPPPGADTAQIGAAPAAPAQPAPPALPPATPPVAAKPVEPIIYPRQGQAPEQQDRDKRACQAWAASQPDAATRADILQRAFAACMEGRGYTVR